jgi:hypothetical protein
LQSLRGGSAAPEVVRQMDHQPGPAGAGPADDGETGVPGGPAAERDASQPAAAAEPASAGAATGDARVDAALKLLDRLPGLPVSEHPELFEQVHAQLSDVLSELDPGFSGAVS